VAASVSGESWSGYQAVGVAFASGHVLTFRRFGSSTIGDGFSSVWIHGPRGTWTIVTDCPTGLGCGRYFGGEGVRLEQRRIDTRWSGEHTLSVGVPELGLAWVLQLDRRSTGLRAVDALGCRVRLWKVPLARNLLARVAGRLLGCRGVILDSVTPTGDSLRVEPEELRGVATSVARLEGRHLGPMVLLARHVALGPLTMPRCGYFLTGTERFTPSAQSPRQMPMARAV
jgi:hypothetical protein